MAYAGRSRALLEQVGCSRAARSAGRGFDGGPDAELVVDEDLAEPARERKAVRLLGRQADLTAYALDVLAGQEAHVGGVVGRACPLAGNSSTVMACGPPTWPAR